MRKVLAVKTVSNQRSSRIKEPGHQQIPKRLHKLLVQLGLRRGPRTQQPLLATPRVLRVKTSDASKVRVQEEQSLQRLKAARNSWKQRLLRLRLQQLLADKQQ